MIIQNKDEANKIFIDDSLYSNRDFTITAENNGIVFFSKDDEDTFNICINENIFLYDIKKIAYEPVSDSINIFIDDEKLYGGSTIQIKENELVSLQYEKDTLNISTVEIPLFMQQDNIDGSYPKFEMTISECIYKMKIYLNEEEFINIPFYQSHNDIMTTLNHIVDVVYYLKIDNPAFIKILCECSKVEIDIFDKNDKTKCIGCNTYDYRISPHGIILFDKSFKDGVCLVEWQKLFRLVIDRTWQMLFE